MRAAIEAGIGLLPEERKRDGIVPGRPITSNVGLPSLGRFAPAGMVRRRALRDETQEMMQRLDLGRSRSTGRSATSAAATSRRRSSAAGSWRGQILLFDEPTRGIDVGAKAEIYNLIEALAAEGRGIIVVSSELPEILRLADRVLVMREGRISASLERDQLSEEAIVAHAIPQSRTRRRPQPNPARKPHKPHKGGYHGNDTRNGRRYRALRPLSRFELRDAGTLIGLVLIFVIFSALAPTFLTAPNLLNILQQSSINACIALGMTLVIISGGIDLSVGPTAAMAAVTAASLLTGGAPIVVAIGGALLIGALAGAINGALIAYGGLQPFIVTLGTLSLYRASALIYTGGNPIFGLPPEFRTLFNSAIFGVPSAVVIVGVIAFIIWVVLNKTPLGEYLMAVGGNSEAAYISGVPVAMTKIAAYVISGVLAAVASLILIGRLGAAEPTLGNLWELDAIAAAAIGGASLMGGKGSVVGTILGAIILGSLRNGLTLLNVQAFYQLLATGLIIIAAMLVDRATRGRG